MKSFTLAPGVFRGFKIMVATTGYTGEQGCEIFVQAKGTVALWQELLRQGETFQVMPIGLGARDTLRTEKKFSLYGHEIDDMTNPYEAGLGWVVKPQAKDFIGKQPILAAKERGLQQKLVGFKMEEKGIPRQGYELFAEGGERIGRVTSGTHSPTLDAPIGIGFVRTQLATDGSEIFVDIRGRKVKAKVCPTPFV